MIYSKPNYDNTEIIFANHESGYSVTVVITDDTLHSIALGSQWLNLTIGEIISALGIPSYIFANVNMGSEIQILQPEMTLYYPENGYVFHLRSSDGLYAQREQNTELKVCVSEDALVSGVEITNAGSISDVLEYLEFPTTRSTVSLNQLDEWQGFGCIVVPNP